MLIVLGGPDLATYQIYPLKYDQPFTWKEGLKTEKIFSHGFEDAERNVMSYPRTQDLSL